MSNIKPTAPSTFQVDASSSKSINLIHEKQVEFDADIIELPQEPKSREFNVFIMKGSHVIPGRRG